MFSRCVGNEDAFFLPGTLAHQTLAEFELFRNWPRSGDFGQIRLVAPLAIGTAFASHTRDLRSLAGLIAPATAVVGFGDVVELVGKITSHEIHVLVQVFPRIRDAAHVCLEVKTL